MEASFIWHLLKGFKLKGIKGFNLLRKTFLFPNLSACPTGATSDGTKKCECTATGATTDGTADCKCAENFQLNDAMTECVGKSHRIVTSNKEKDFSPKKRRIEYLYFRIYKL